MGCSSSVGLDIVLTDAVIPSLKSCKYLTLMQVKVILDSLISPGRRSITVPPDKVQSIISRFLKNTSELCDAFTMKVGYVNERFINIYYLVSALTVYSYASWENKVRCNVYLVIYNLFVNSDTSTIGIEEMKLMIQSVVKGVYLMTGRKLPNNKIFCELAIEVSNRVNLKRDMRVEYEELIKYVILEPELMAALNTRISIQSVKSRAESFSLHPHPLLRRKTPRNCNTSNDLSHTRINCKSLGDLSVFGSPKLGKFPVLNSPVVSDNNSSKKEEVISRVYSKLQESKLIVSEKDILNYMRRNAVCNPRLYSLKKWSNESLSCEEAIAKLRPYFKYINTGMLDTKKQQIRRKERLSTLEMKTYAELYERGDSEKKGWDKVDIMDNIGVKSNRSAYFLIKKFKVSSNRRLRFSDFLQVSLPDNVEINEDKANRYYLNRVKTVAT